MSSYNFGMRALKGFGLGIVWALLLPFLLVAVGIVAVWGVINFLIQFVIMLVNFFRGKKVFPPFPEDEKAYTILKKAYDKQNGDIPENTPAPAATGQQVFVQQNFYTTPGQQIPGVQTQLPPGYQQPLPPGYTNVPGVQGAPNTYIPGQGTPEYLPPQSEPVDVSYEEAPKAPDLMQIPVYDPNKEGDE